MNINDDTSASVIVSIWRVCKKSKPPVKKDKFAAAPLIYKSLFRLSTKISLLLLYIVFLEFPTHYHYYRRLSISTLSLLTRSIRKKIGESSDSSLFKLMKIRNNETLRASRQFYNTIEHALIKANKN